MDKLKMHSVNKVDENIEKIGKLFPNCVTERIGANGKVEHAIDFDVLKQELSSVVVEGNEERYQFTWPDKKKSVLLANAPINKTLRPCREESVDFDNTENLYIEGDNLEVLKLLQETYLGKVKLIYIDPPYNTGNDFVYADDFAQSTGEYLENSGQFDDEGNRLVKNLDSNGRFHTDWLNMIYPRLKLAKDLLSDDGVIFISIDDNEQENLKKCCDEVFGASNFIGCFLWKKKSTSTNVANALVSAQTDYQLCYGKNTSPLSLNRRATTTEERKYPFIDKNGNYRTTIIEKKDSGDYARASMKYPILGIYPREGKRWQIGEKTAREYEAQNRFIIDDGVVKLKIYEKDDKTTYSANPTLLLDYGSTDSAAKETNINLFKQAELFSNPKPTELLHHFIKMATNTDSIVLDFFSGSATTAHAVMQLNAEDSGHRKFIMVQIPEETDEKSEAYKAGYKNICEIGKERIRRAGKKIKTELEESGYQLKMLDKAKPYTLAVRRDDDKSSDPNYISDPEIITGKSTGLYDTPENLEDINKSMADSLDIGFRVLKLDSSNMKEVYYNPSDYTPSLFDNLTDNIKEDRTPEDLLFQVMLDLGILLSSKIEETTIDGKKVFSVEDGFLIACFDKEVTEETIKAIAQQKPYYFVMRDSSMASDSVAVNFEQIFAAYSPDTVRKVL